MAYAFFPEKNFPEINLRHAYAVTVAELKRAEAALLETLNSIVQRRTADADASAPALIDDQMEEVEMALLEPGCASPAVYHVRRYTRAHEEGLRAIARELDLSENIGLRPVLVSFGAVHESL